jgi:hypothetical protein
VESVVVTPGASSLEVGERTTLGIAVKWSDGTETSPPADAKLRFKTAGGDYNFGIVFAADLSEQPVVSLWRGATTDKYFLAAVRPGTTSVTVEVDGIAAAPFEFSAAYSALPNIRVSLPDGSGAAAGVREKDTDVQIRLTTKTFGAGGLTSSLRFAAVAKAGDVLDFENPPEGTVVQLTASIGDLGGLQVKVPAGRLWIDQTDKGLFRGTFLGQSAALQPVVGSFVVQRSGEFGIDILDDPVLLAESTAPNPSVTGNHVGRVTVTALEDGRALIQWRTVKDVTKADLTRKLLDTKTGILTDLPPLVENANTTYKNFDTGETKEGPAIGWSGVAESQGKVLAMWEGRAGTGVQLPNQIQVQELDPKTLEKKGQPLIVSDDDCSGQCRPQIHRLPNSRWLVLWGKPDGSGLRSRRIDGNLAFSELKPVDIIQVPANRPSAAVIEDNIAIIWRTTDQGVWYKLYTSAMSALAPEQQLTEPQAGLPAPAVAAILDPPSFAAIFAEPATTARYRRINLSGSEIGTEDVVLGNSITHSVAAGGQLGQVVVVSRVDPGKGPDAPTKNQLLVTKMETPTPSVTGVPLGLPHTVPSSSGTWVVEPSIVYVPATNSYVLVWGGDDKGKSSIWMQRFR